MSHQILELNDRHPVSLAEIILPHRHQPLLINSHWTFFDLSVAQLDRCRSRNLSTPVLTHLKSLGILMTFLHGLGLEIVAAAASGFTIKHSSASEFRCAGTCASVFYCNVDAKVLIKIAEKQHFSCPQ